VQANLPDHDHNPLPRSLRILSDRALLYHAPTPPPFVRIQRSPRTSYRFLAGIDIRAAASCGRVRAPAFAILDNAGSSNSVAFDPPYICKSVVACGEISRRNDDCRRVTRAPQARPPRTA
jgi:hypothetical protein